MIIFQLKREKNCEQCDLNNIVHLILDEIPCQSLEGAEQCFSFVTKENERGNQKSLCNDVEFG
jgi:hypothetical protein